MARSFRGLLNERRVKLGHLVAEFATPGIGHILAGAGAEFAFFDMEHSGFHHETVKSVVRYVQAADLPTAVRVPSKEYHHLARAADVGAEAIIVPMVGTAEEAEALVRHIKYCPRGLRGVALGLAHDDYREGPVVEKLARLNERMCFIALIETARGVENVDAIAAIDGVDCLWMGHFDLSCSMGIPGEFGRPEFKEAVDRIVGAARKHGKALGRLVPDVATALAEAERGFDLICYSGDAWLLQSALKDGIDRIREGLRAR